MLDLLNDFLSKKGVNPGELKSEDQAVYAQWEKALSGRRITDQDVRDFFDRELNMTVRELAKAELGTRTDLFLKMRIDFLLKIKGFLGLPDLEKKMAEAGISELVGKK